MDYRERKDYDWYRHVFCFREIEDALRGKRALWIRLGHGAKGEYDRHMPPNLGFILNAHQDDITREITRLEPQDKRFPRPRNVDAIVLQDDGATSGTTMAMAFASIIRKSRKLGLVPDENGQAHIYGAVYKDSSGIAHFALKRDYEEFLGPVGFVKKNCPDLHDQLLRHECYRNLKEYVPKCIRALSQVSAELQSEELRKFVQMLLPVFVAFRYEADAYKNSLLVVDKRAEKFARGLANFLAAAPHSPCEFVSDISSGFPVVIDYGMNHKTWEEMNELAKKKYDQRGIYIALIKDPFDDANPAILPLGSYVP